MAGLAKAQNGHFFQRQFHPARDKHGGRARYEEEDGRDEHQGKIIGDLTPQAPPLLDPPDVVEGDLNLRKDLDDGVKEKNQPHARHKAPFDVFEKGVGKVHDSCHHLFLPTHIFQQDSLQPLLKAETLGDPEHHGHDGYDGQKREESEGRGPKRCAILKHASDAQNGDPEGPDEKDPGSGQIPFAYAPEALSQIFVDPHTVKRLQPLTCSSPFSGQAS